MRIVSERKLKEFARRHVEASSSLQGWAAVVESSIWKNPAELRRTFGTADFVGDKTVFNLGGNRYRLIAYVHYRARIVFIKHILTHAEYDRGDWK